MQIQSWPTLEQCLSVMVFTRICALLKTLSWWFYLVPPLQVAQFWTDKHQYIQISTPFIFICPYKRVLTIFFIIERPFILISKQFHTTLLCVLAVISISKGTISTNKNSYFVYTHWGLCPKEVTSLHWAPFLQFSKLNSQLWC